ncbi:trypsin-like serine peptidase [Streptomyces scopuliridis]|uniref:trypsin-like serine peptidase n=1 Tax=Streptomyces scopuliridis TaxID=452529 RepID=UPI003697D72C
MSLPPARRIRRFCLVLAATAAFGFAGVTAPAAAHGEQDATASPAAAAVATAKKTAKDLDAYWTPQRMKAAEEIPAPAALSGTRSGERTAARQLSATGISASADAVVPKGATPRPLGSVGTQAADISVSQRWPGPTTSWPLNVVGKLFATLPDGRDGQCSASVIVSNTGSALWTAAHCVHEGKNNENGFFSNVTFAPAYHGGQTPWGKWEADKLIVPTSWADGDFDRQLDADMGSVVLKPLAPYGKIQDAMGAYGYQFSFNTDYSDVLTFGYPSEGYQRPDSDFYDAEYLMYCYGNTEDAFPGFPLDNRLKMDCDMGRGSSGGPFLTGNLEDIKIVGANSHTNGAGTDRQNDDLFSSEHANHAIGVINAVNAL